MENAVVIEGNVSAEDADDPRIILSAVSSLGKGVRSESGKNVKAESVTKKLYIKLTDTADDTLRPIYRIATFNRGKTPIIIFDARTKKYAAIKGISTSPDDNVINKLREIYGHDNVVLK